MPKSKMIVIWGSENILNSSIEILLAARSDWEVFHISNQEELDTMILAVATTQPDIVIIHQGRHEDPSNLPLQWLQDHPAIRVITISLEDNLMDIYSKQKKLVKQASDLITVIENEV